MAKRIYQLLVQHNLYEKITSMDRVRAFMEQHIICVWSYHSILKQLQQDLLSALQPFGGERVREALHLMSQLILEEEVGQTADGRYVSLFELYLEALQAIGGDTSHIMTFFDALDAGKDIEESIDLARFSPAAREYALHTAEALKLNPLQKAVTLYYETEPFIPMTLLNQITRLNKKSCLDDLLTYFHLHLDGMEFADGSPMSQLVGILGGDCEMLEEESNMAAETVLKHRLMLWDEISINLDTLPALLLSVPLNRHLRLVR